MLHILDQVTCEETIVDKFLWTVDGAGRPPAPAASRICT